MMCKIYVSENQFRGWFTNSQYVDNFTYEQLSLLYEHIESLADENGFSPYGNDVVAIACTYSGYTELELLEEYATEERPDIDSLIDYLQSETSICWDSARDNFIVEEF